MYIIASKGLPSMIALQVVSVKIHMDSSQCRDVTK